MADRFPPFGTVPTRPRCHYCGGVIVVDLHADDELWCAVMREKFGTGYTCVNCFASRADEKMIDWAPHVRLIPLSLSGQMRVQAARTGAWPMEEQPDGTVTACDPSDVAPASEPPNLGCNVPPLGWWCSREPGHDGPCAAREDRRNVGDNGRQGSITLSADDAAFLAARLRRLFDHHGYELPDFAKDDGSLIGIAGSCIGAVLTNAAAAPALVQGDA